MGIKVRIKCEMTVMSGAMMMSLDPSSHFTLDSNIKIMVCKSTPSTIPVQFNTMLTLILCANVLLWGHLVKLLFQTKIPRNVVLLIVVFCMSVFVLGFMS